MTKSGVNPNLYQTYDFDDHIWKLTGRDDLLELAEWCVKLPDHYEMKIPKTNVWESFEKLTDAKKQAKNTWTFAHLKCGKQITPELIDTFFDGVEVTYDVVNKKATKRIEPVGACPNLHGKMVIPYGPRFITYRGRHYLNTDETNVRQGNNQNIKLGLMILELVYRSLCNGEELHSDKGIESAILLKQVLDDDMRHLEFRFVMNWLAAIVQTPGVNLQTNLWLIGRQQGIGKGTIVKIMKAILGSNLVGTLNQDEIESGGYTNHLLGKALVEVNEFDTKKSRKDWNKWIKEHTCEPELSVKLRYGTAYTALNIGNYLFTSNDEHPIYLDQADRRNMIVKTTNDEYWKHYAQAITQAYILPRLNDLATGFAWILEQVKVDFKLINSAPMTQIKADIQAMSVDPVEDWIENDVTFQRDKWMDVPTLHEYFKQWFTDAYPGKAPYERSKFGRELTRLANDKLINKRKVGTMSYEIPAQITRIRANEVSLANVVSDTAAICGEVVAIANYDQDVTKDKYPPVPPTKMQRLRAILKQENG